MENNLRPAGFWPRLAAFALDFVPIMGYAALLLAITLAVTVGLFNWQLDNAKHPVLWDAIAFLTIVLPVLLYFALQESSPKMATWGKQRMGLKVVSVKGERLSFGQAFLRTFVKLIPWQMAHTCIFHIPGWPFAVEDFPAWVGVGFITIYAVVAVYLFTLLVRPHRTPYDWIARTMVIGK